jgi:hypothetical protein
MTKRRCPGEARALGEGFAVECSYVVKVEGCGLVNVLCDLCCLAFDDVEALANHTRSAHYRWNSTSAVVDGTVSCASFFDELMTDLAGHCCNCGAIDFAALRTTDEWGLRGLYHCPVCRHTEKTAGKMREHQFKAHVAFVARRVTSSRFFNVFP